MILVFKDKIHFVLLFEKEDNRIVHIEYYIAKDEKKDYNVVTDEKNSLNQPVKSDMTTMIMTTFKKMQQVKGNDCTTGCLLA